MEPSLVQKPSPTEIDLLAEVKRFWSEDRRFFSNAGKEERERWVVGEFLTHRPIPFSPNELRSHPQQSKVDVEFRDARFQVKEIPDPSLRRSDEINAIYRRVMSARTLQDTIGPSFVSNVPPVVSAYELVRDTACELACSEKYKHHKATLDLLFYVTRTRASLIAVQEIKPEELLPLGWRSISCLMGNRAVVLCAGPEVPAFLRPSS
jgi:hypothetical protein